MISREELQNKKRILVLGRSGSGKSTFAKLLGEKLNIEVFHLDQKFHDPDWQPKEQSEFINSVREILTKNEWIIDGNYSSTLKERILKADAVYLYDYSRYLCIFRVIKRSIRSNTGMEVRTELPEGCTENFIPEYEFLKFVWKYKTSKIYSIIEETNFDRKNLMIFNDRKKFRDYLRQLNY
ncbi:MAG TPA: hypothetical protein PKA90_04095 [Ignavibacteria bacterium]|nr:hypothetical protein [Ignavibacteria bacterium]HMR39591.1 hypothetical protein [Ignavibacteria bacterium]